MQTHTAAISLDLTVNGDSLAGRATDEAGTSREFSGWLGLVSVIEELISTDSQGADE
jgi:hypothetical protein